MGNKLEKLPEIVKARVEELDKLIAEHPKKIPTVKVAKFLGMDIECLRRGIEQGVIPFALGCKNDEYGNRYSYVSSTTFYLWCMSPLL